MGRHATQTTGRDQRTGTQKRLYWWSSFKAVSGRLDYPHRVSRCGTRVTWRVSSHLGYTCDKTTLRQKLPGLRKATLPSLLTGKERRFMLSKTSRVVWLRLIFCSLLICVLMACSTSTGVPAPSVTKGSSQAPSPTVSPTPTLGAPGCHPPSPLDKSNLGFPEAQGTTSALDLWSLFLGSIPPVKEDGKIIWRIGTSFQDPLHIVGLGPHGLHLLPLFLERHAGSNWDRPGGEWGTGFNFPVAGCWDLHVTGGTTVGDVWIVLS